MHLSSTFPFTRPCLRYQGISRWDMHTKSSLSWNLINTNFLSPSLSDLPFWVNCFSFLTHFLPFPSWLRKITQIRLKEWVEFPKAKDKMKLIEDGTWNLSQSLDKKCFTASSGLVSFAGYLVVYFEPSDLILSWRTHLKEPHIRMKYHGSSKSIYCSAKRNVWSERF